MDGCPFDHDCQGCSGRLLCRCLQITEEAVAEAVSLFGLTTVKEVRERTGAGDGCTACHRRIRLVLQQVRADQQLAQSPSSSPSPI
jgi:bacterioferritin-associated ferredoxin